MWMEKSKLTIRITTEIGVKSREYSISINYEQKKNIPFSISKSGTIVNEALELLCSICSVHTYFALTTYARTYLHIMSEGD